MVACWKAGCGLRSLLYGRNAALTPMFAHPLARLLAQAAVCQTPWRGGEAAEPPYYALSCAQSPRLSSENERTMLMHPSSVKGFPKRRLRASTTTPSNLTTVHGSPRRWSSVIAYKVHDALSLKLCRSRLALCLRLLFVDHPGSGAFPGPEIWSCFVEATGLPSQRRPSPSSSSSSRSCLQRTVRHFCTLALRLKSEGSLPTSPVLAREPLPMRTTTSRSRATHRRSSSSLLPATSSLIHTCNCCCQLEASCPRALQACSRSSTATLLSFRSAPSRRYLWYFG